MNWMHQALKPSPSCGSHGAQLDDFLDPGHGFQIVAYLSQTTPSGLTAHPGQRAPPHAGRYVQK